MILTALAPFASDPTHSRGRLFAQAAAPTRNDYQRDRDRVIHSSAFRRLVYKTQVFLNHEGDLFRTRLTHSLEVAQLGRSLARSLGLHEDLVEAIALAHDLGHTPFGHAGQDALDACMRAHHADDAVGAHNDSPGFEHNLQSLRVVDTLERRYPSHDGLNLTFETREGILKHCSAANASRLEELRPNDVGARFLEGTAPSLEAQLCNLADEIAYNAHDVDDGVRSGLIDFEQLQAVDLVAEHAAHTLRDYPQLSGRRLLAETIRRLLTAQVFDVLAHTQHAIQEAGIDSAQAVRKHGKTLVAFTPSMRARSIELKQFLFANLYRHEQVLDTTARARQVVADLFSIYVQDPTVMPAHYQRYTRPARAAADYIAGMTDRFAIQAHARLTGYHMFASAPGLYG
ncbi:Deoxyguanosinetriphosphate triphosphohydrolase [Betaproteobacteria bacterium MOLA814]|nr:Deoxyguanosinetriphosphate triphosphohydrolase [Betaproteobacteria bacterium MOLA814]